MLKESALLKLSNLVSLSLFHFVFLVSFQVPQTHQSPKYPSISYASFPLNKLQLPKSNIWDKEQAGLDGGFYLPTPLYFM